MYTVQIAARLKSFDNTSDLQKKPEVGNYRVLLSIHDKVLSGILAGRLRDLPRSNTGSSVFQVKSTENHKQFCNKNNDRQNTWDSAQGGCVCVLLNPKKIYTCFLTNLHGLKMTQLYIENN